MAASSRYRMLFRHVRKLREYLLPRRFDPMGSYSDRQRQRALSFRIHVHGEIEYFLEESQRQILAGGRASLASASLAPPLMELLNAKLDAKEGTIRDNHGIKEKNVKRLFADLTFDFTALPVTLLADLTSYGKQRGAVAHSSRAVYTATILANPQDEWNKARQIVTDLGSLDSEVVRLCRLF